MNKKKNNLHFFCLIQLIDCNIGTQPWKQAFSDVIVMLIHLRMGIKKKKRSEYVYNIPKHKYKMTNPMKSSKGWEMFQHTPNFSISYKCAQP